MKGTTKLFVIELLKTELRLEESRVESLTERIREVSEEMAEELKRLTTQKSAVEVHIDRLKSAIRDLEEKRDDKNVALPFVHGFHS